MELLWIFSSLTIVCLIKQTVAGCEQDLAKDQRFTNCITSYSMYIANAAVAADPSDQTAMVTMMCSAEGKAAMACVIGYSRRCPALSTSTDPMTLSVFGSWAQIEQFGGMENYCKVVTSMTGPCKAVQECLTSKNFDMNYDPSPPTPFSFMQPATGSLCGQFKVMLDCFKDAGDQCSSLEKNLKQAMELGRNQTPNGTIFPLYKDAKRFTMKECSKLPSDFATSTCVKNSLTTPAFVKCYQNVTSMYPPKNNMISCEAYKARHSCIQMEVGEKCGQKYTDAFVRVTKVFLAGIPKEGKKNCIEGRKKEKKTKEKERKGKKTKKERTQENKRKKGRS